MPNTKASHIRIKAIDDSLRKKPHTIEELKTAINSALAKYDGSEVSSTNTIRRDLDHIRFTYSQVKIIEGHRYGKAVTYAYEDSTMSIFKLPFNDEEIALMEPCFSILKQFTGLPHTEWLEDFLERVKKSIHIELNGQPIVSFDECTYLVGREYFSKLLAAISRKRVLKIHYKNFRKNVTDELVFHPYYLKEYNKRWFLMGIREGYTNLTILALDRIEDIEMVDMPEYRPNTEFDFSGEFFDDIIGVTHNPGPVETIRLRVDNTTFPYINTKPLHPTQTIIKSESNDQYTTISIQVIPNFELEQLLLTYGEGVTVLSPDTFKERMRQRIAAMARNYEE